MRKIYLLLILSLGIVLSSCTKEDKDENEMKDEAGLGCNVEVTVFPKLNCNAVFSTSDYLDSAYVKFNTLEYPGESPSLYDLAVASDLSDHIHVKGLKKGDYMFYVTGMDTASNSL